MYDSADGRRRLSPGCGKVVGISRGSNKYPMAKWKYYYYYFHRWNEREKERKKKQKKKKINKHCSTEAATRTMSENSRRANGLLSPIVVWWPAECVCASRDILLRSKMPSISPWTDDLYIDFVFLKLFSRTFILWSVLHTHTRQIDDRQHFCIKMKTNFFF